jgi:hypothetical protein
MDTQTKITRASTRKKYASLLEACELGSENGADQIIDILQERDELRLQSATQTAAEQRYWIQQYNFAGRNWIDNVGFDNSKTLDEAVKSLKGMQKAFTDHTFRLIVRTDAVLQ